MYIRSSAHVFDVCERMVRFLVEFPLIIAALEPNNVNDLLRIAIDMAATALPLPLKLRPTALNMKTAE
ncbi:hypothetical protein [Bifidobacterium panos]|nr:hypothetical protein [Bifidobacterium sp. DSM 109963]